MGVGVRVLAFGDDIGIPQTLRHLPPEAMAGIVCAGIRPHQHAAVRCLAQSHDVPFFVQPSHATPEYGKFLEELQSLAPDLILVNCYSMLLYPEVLAIPRLGGVNVHGALLPKYRGANPIQWAILGREHETGVTMHYMTAEIDAGDIIAQERVLIHFEDTWCDVLARILGAADVLLARELPRLLAGTNGRSPQDTTRARRFPRRKPEDGEIREGASILDTYNLVRALVGPLPGAFLRTASGIARLQRYLTISEVARLRYGAGRVRLETENLAVHPLQARDVVPLLRVLRPEDGWLIDAGSAAAAPERFFEETLRDNRTVWLTMRSLRDGVPRGFACLCQYDPRRGAATLWFRSSGGALPAEDSRGVLELAAQFAVRELDVRLLAVRAAAHDQELISSLAPRGFLPTTRTDGTPPGYSESGVLLAWREHLDS